MPLGTISTLGTMGVEATSTNNTAFSLTGTQAGAVGRLVACFAVLRSASLAYDTLSSTNVEEWFNVGTFSFALNGSAPAQTITVFVGRVSSAATATVTATATGSITSIAGGFSWMSVATSGLTANTTWVVEDIGSLRNTASSADCPCPSLTPLGANRAYIGYIDASAAVGTTGQTAGYTIANESSGMGNQWLTNLSVSTTQAPNGRATSGPSDTIGLLLRAHEADTAVAANLNIGTAGGKNHFKLQAAFSGYTEISELSQAQLVAGQNTDPQFLALSSGSVQFSARMDAPTTDGSSFPRSELREMATDGVTNYGFNPTSGVHWMRGRTKITQLTPVRPRIVIAQVHDAGSDLLAVCSQDSGGATKLLLRVNGSSSMIPVMSALYTVGDVVDWQIYFNASYWAVYYQDFGTPFYDSTAHSALIASNAVLNAGDGGTRRVDAVTFTGSADCYYKCGCYTQSNETFDTATSYEAVELSYLRHWHTGWTTADAVTLPKTFQFAPAFG
jgi:hypothetical protein